MHVYVGFPGTQLFFYKVFQNAAQIKFCSSVFVLYTSDFFKSKFDQPRKHIFCNQIYERIIIQYNSNSLSALKQIYIKFFLKVEHQA